MPAWSPRKPPASRRPPHSARQAISSSSIRRMTFRRKGLEALRGGEDHRRWVWGWNRPLLRLPDGQRPTRAIDTSQERRDVHLYHCHPRRGRRDRAIAGSRSGTTAGHEDADAMREEPAPGSLRAAAPDRRCGAAGSASFCRRSSTDGFLANDDRPYWGAGRELVAGCMAWLATRRDCQAAHGVRVSLLNDAARRGGERLWRVDSAMRRGTDARPSP